MVFVGRFYGTDYDQTKYGDLYRPTNEWSLALMLAQGEGFDLRIGGPDQNGSLWIPKLFIRTICSKHY